MKKACNDYPLCPICEEPIDYCAGHGEHNLCTPDEPCGPECPAS